MMSVEKINALTQIQRDEALHRARLRLIGSEPEPGREPEIGDFERRGSGRYPPGVMRVIRGLAVVMLLAAFVPSAIRLHQIGKEVFGQSVTDAMSTAVAALSIVLSAEIGQVIFSLAAAVLPEREKDLTQRRRDAKEEKEQRRLEWQRVGLLAGALICTLIALAGNGEVVRPWAAPAGLFIWLETFAPPVLVLITAQVLKTQMLHSIEDRHGAHLAYERARADWNADYDERLRAWQDRYAHADEDAQWMKYAANALRDALRGANRRSYAVVRALTDEDWRGLIQREMQAEQWYVRAERARELPQRNKDGAGAASGLQSAKGRPPEPERQSVRAGASGGVHTGETSGQVNEVDGGWRAICPHCGREFRKSSEQGARNALAAHVGRFCAARPVSENGRVHDGVEA